ncbi:hypothetical protein ASG31_17560 [Chryseobacterium sp. Leaf404]|uniref:SdrD B-like domain-containing protein n=1 Tax=unclassified Chryseobacterium TaxID=2593645 RepID=UPI0006FFC5E1|nr:MULTISPECIES: SdrD B-like domain-containing protein [unclassified Chryseobacterium]KQT20575.1 hypothetical protein ASG31_17560 [Chryseobacterium sp. Leaf404]
MKATYIRILFSLLPVACFSQSVPEKIYTDFNGFWESNVNNSLIPNNSHNLIAFKLGNTVFSTGVNDNLLTSKGIVFSARNFAALPITSNPVPINGTYIGVGRVFEGDGDVSPIPVSAPLSQYLTDGNHGLDLGTAIFNFPSGAEIKYQIQDISIPSIGDGVPDLIITQMGQISNVQDRYSFRNSAGTVVGTEFNVDLSTVQSLGLLRWKFYNAHTTPITYNTTVGPNDTNNTRDVRVLALDWADLGITSANAAQVSSFNQVFSGQSDLSFTAYNKNSISLRMPVSGSVFKDNNGGIPNGLPFQNVSLSLKNSSGVTVATTVTDFSGFYSFQNILAGNYTVTISTPAGYEIVGNSAGNLSSTLNVQISDAPVQNRNFGLYRLPCVKPGLAGAPAGYGKLGILTKKAITLSKWPTTVPNGTLVIDSDSKGLVITHMTTSQRNALSAVEGMMIYNTDLQCVQIFRGNNPGVDKSRTGWNCVVRGCNEE